MTDFKVGKRSVKKEKTPKDQAIFDLVKNVVEEKQKEKEEEDVQQTNQVKQKEAE